MTSETRMVKPSDIVVDEELAQLRASTDARWVQELSDKMKLEGFRDDKPLVVWARTTKAKKTEWVLIDGFHRHRAAVLAGFRAVPTIAFVGSWTEALAFGVEQNKAHGMTLNPQSDYKIAAKKLYAAGMKVQSVCDILFGRARNSARKHPKLDTVARWAGIRNTAVRDRNLATGRRTYTRIRDRAKAAVPHDDLDLNTVEGNEQLFERATKSEKAKSELEGRQAAAEMIFQGLAAPVATPDWAQADFARPDSNGIPVLFVSDVHAGEVVNREEMSGRNEYNWEIMEQRLDRLFSTAGYLPTLLVGHKPAGAYVILGGDMVSGDIHEELRETNEVGPVEAAKRFPALLTGHLLSLADKFGNVHVKGVAGNHGRSRQKPQAKLYAKSNFDWLIYHTIQQLIEARGDKRFTFEFPESRDLRFNIYNRRFLLTHGDQFRGGDGMIGGIGPIMRGDVRKRTNAAFGLPLSNGLDAAYDTIMMGHWHQTIFTPYLIVNGSVKGLDEYAASINVRQEGPTQWLFQVHPKYGIIWPNPIYL